MSWVSSVAIKEDWGTMMISWTTSNSMNQWNSLVPVTILTLNNKSNRSCWFAQPISDRTTSCFLALKHRNHTKFLEQLRDFIWNEEHEVVSNPWNLFHKLEFQPNVNSGEKHNSTDGTFQRPPTKVKIQILNRQ